MEVLKVYRGVPGNVVHIWRYIRFFWNEWRRCLWTGNVSANARGHGANHCTDSTCHYILLH